MSTVASSPAAVKSAAGEETAERGEQELRQALTGLAGLHLGTGAIALAAPGLLYKTIDGFGTRNDHFMRHVGTMDVALGATLLVAAREPNWRLPSLFAATSQSALHLALHLFEPHPPRPPWVRHLDYGLIAAVTAGLATCLLRARRLERARAASFFGQG